MPDSTEAGLRSREGLYGLVFAITSLITAVLMVFAPDRFLSSVAWQFILDKLPGGHPVLVGWLFAAAVGMIIALKVQYKFCWFSYIISGAWYVFVAVFQVICVLSEPRGPLGFMAWGALGICIIIFGLGRTRHLK
jgi:hypothetical protein